MCVIIYDLQKTVKFVFSANVHSLKELEEKVHKSDTLGLDNDTLEKLIDAITNHEYQSVKITNYNKSLRKITLQNCLVLDLPPNASGKILTCLIPREKLNQTTVRTFATWILTNCRRLDLENSLNPALRWVNCVLHHGVCNIEDLQFAYEPFFQILGLGSSVVNIFSLSCTLLDSLCSFLLVQILSSN